MQAAAAFVLAFACAAIACTPPGGEAGSTAPQLRLVAGGRDGAPASVRVTGLGERTLAELRRMDAAAWRDMLAVYTAAAADDPLAPPLLGTHSVDQESVTFIPRFPFIAGTTYAARWTPPRGGGAMEIEFSVDAPASTGTAHVTALYPSAEVWPMNQLKMYVHFSSSMRRGQAFEHIRLIDEETGAEVDQPFATVQEELWNADRTVLTVLYDPARIKRGLVPHQQAGLPLRQGKSYRLVIDAAWPDGAGSALAQSFERVFQVGALDRTSPHPNGWGVSVPRQGTRDPLRVDFGEPMDHGLMHSLIGVRHARTDVGPRAWRTESRSTAADELIGETEVTHEETAWQFVPSRDWSAGTYEVVIPTILEDLAGNTLRGLFDIDLGDPTSELADTEAVYLLVHVDG